MISVSRADLAPLTLEEARRFDADQRRNLRSWGLEVPEPPTPPTQPEVHSYHPTGRMFKVGNGATYIDNRTAFGSATVFSRGGGGFTTW